MTMVVIMMIIVSFMDDDAGNGRIVHASAIYHAGLFHHGWKDKQGGSRRWMSKLKE